MTRSGIVIPLFRHGPLRSAQPETRPALERHPRLKVLAAVLGALLFLAFWAGAPRRSMNQLRELPDAARAALYRGTLREVQSICTPPAVGGAILREHCISQARFLALFSDCDQECQRAVRAVLPRTHR